MPRARSSTRKTLPIAALVLSSLTVASGAPKLHADDAPPADVLLPSVVDPILADLLVPHPSRITRLSSSHDPFGGNRDNDCDTLATQKIDDQDYLEMFAAEGEGRITRLWMNADYDHDIPTHWKELWIVADGQTVFRGDPLDWFCGKAGFVSPMVMNQMQSSGAYVSWVPIPYRKSARVLWRGYPHYFQVSHREGKGSASGPTAESIARALTDAWWTRLAPTSNAARVTAGEPLTIASGPTLVTELALAMAPADVMRARIRIGQIRRFLRAICSASACRARTSPGRTFTARSRTPTRRGTCWRRERRCRCAPVSESRSRRTGTRPSI